MGQGRSPSSGLRGERRATCPRYPSSRGYRKRRQRRRRPRPSTWSDRHTALGVVGRTSPSGSQVEAVGTRHHEVNEASAGESDGRELLDSRPRTRQGDHRSGRSLAQSDFLALLNINTASPCSPSLVRQGNKARRQKVSQTCVSLEVVFFAGFHSDDTVMLRSVVGGGRGRRFASC